LALLSDYSGDRFFSSGLQARQCFQPRGSVLENTWGTGKYFPRTLLIPVCFPVSIKIAVFKSGITDLKTVTTGFSFKSNPAFLSLLSLAA